MNSKLIVFVMSILMLPLMVLSKSSTVVELFTSQGCSSCPPADRLVTSKQKSFKHGEVYFLAFHVTYWDYLGWQDPYGRDQFTKRQRKYSSIHHEGTLFTPQFRVNGGPGFADHDGRKLMQSVNAVHHDNQLIELSIDQLTYQHNQLTIVIDIHYMQPRLSNDLVLNIALTENKLTTQVLAGENQGKLLKSDAVVRWFKTISNGLPPKRVITQLIPIDSTWKMHNLNIIVFMQNQSNGQVLGAVGQSLNKQGD